MQFYASILEEWYHLNITAKIYVQIIPSPGHLVRLDK